MEEPSNGDISYLHTKHDTEELSIEEGRSQYLSQGSARPTEFPRSTRKYLSLFRGNSSSDAGSEGEEVSPSSAEANGEEEKSVSLRGSDADLGNSVVTTCCEEEKRPTDVSAYFEEELGSLDTNSCLEGATVLLGISPWKDETGPPSLSHRLYEENPILKTQMDIDAVNDEQEQANSEDEEVSPLSAEANGEEEKSISLRGSDADSGTSVVTTCCEEERQSSGISSYFKEEPGSLGTNSCLEGKTVLSSISSCWKEETGLAGVGHLLNDEKPISKTRMDINAIDDEQEKANSKSEHFTFDRESSIAEKDAIDAFAPCVMDNSHLEDEHSPVALSISKKCEDFPIYFDTRYVENQLSKDLDEVKESSVDHQKRTSASEKERVEPGILLDEASHCVKLLGSCLQEVPRENVGTGNDSCSNQLKKVSSIEPLRDVDGLIYVMGGYDGMSWLPRMECYSPSLYAVKYLKQMSLIRSNASAAVLNGFIYNCGGWNGYNRLWYDTVECYNPVSNKWTLCPPLSEKKGSLAAASLNNKIFAVGGGNGIDCFRAVEMFDPAIERWIPTQSMLQKRFASAAAVLDGVLYVVGGYDGKKYLKSAERFDLREVSWSKLPNMNTSRGSHALTVFQGKLYALGGHDGNSYVPNIEIFDPRMTSWMEGVEMRKPRGYFAAPVIGDTIYAIGGQTVGNDILDTVETYRLDHGWTETKLNGIGARCLFSAVVC